MGKRLFDSSSQARNRLMCCGGDMELSLAQAVKSVNPLILTEPPSERAKERAPHSTQQQAKYRCRRGRTIGTV